MDVPELPEAPVIVTEAMVWSRDWSRKQAPLYRVEELAKFFFGMSASWLRLKMKADDKHPETWFVSGGERMVFRRNIPGKTDSARIFTLADVQPMAVSLYLFGWGSEERLRHTLNIVRDTAVLYGLLPGIPGDQDAQEPGDEGEGPAPEDT